MLAEATAAECHEIYMKLCSKEPGMFYSQIMQDLWNSVILF